MSGYLEYFKIQLISKLQYRASALAGVFTQFFWGFMFAFIYQVFYSNATGNIGFNYSQLITYIWLNQAFYALIFVRFYDNEIMSAVRQGTVAYELCRPYNLYNWWFVKLISKKYAMVLLRFSPVIILSLLLPAPYNLSLPVNLSILLPVKCTLNKK